MRSSKAFDLGVGESLRFWKKKLIIRTRREIRVQISRLIAKSKMWISISKSGFPNLEQTLEFVPEEARLLIADEDDQFIFQIRWVLHICQDFNSQDFELIIFRNVSSVQWGIQGGFQGLDDPPPPPPPPEGLVLPLLYVFLCIQAAE